MYVLSENTKLYRTFEGPVFDMDQFSLRVRAYSETQSWIVEATNAWSFSQQGNILQFVFDTSNIDIIHTISNIYWKHVNDYVVTIDSNVISLYVNGENTKYVYSETETFKVKPWSVLQLHGGTSPKTVFDLLHLEHNNVWTESNVTNMYDAYDTDERLIQLLNIEVPESSWVRHNVFGGNIEAGRFSVRTKIDKDISIWKLNSSNWVFRYESNVLSFEEPNVQTGGTTIHKIDITTQVSQSASNVSDYIVNVERRKVHFFFNGYQVATRSRAPNIFAWSYLDVEADHEHINVHLIEILVNEVWSSEYITNIFTV
jgi:hypothetical protein